MQRLRPFWRGVAGTARAVRSVRRALQSHPLTEVQPQLSVHDFDGLPGRGARLAFWLTRATCLEHALVLQAWHARRGVHRDVVIGFRKDDDSFDAHAWLAVDETVNDISFTELARLASRAPR